VKHPRHIGGAVRTNCRLIIFNTLFQSCEGLEGAVSCRGRLDSEFVTFQNCSAKRSGALNLQSQSNHQTIINLTLFEHCKSDFFGACYRSSDGIFDVIGVNFSQIRADECVGCLESSSGVFHLLHTLINRSSARAHHGGFVLRQCAKIQIDRCHFAYCFHTSSERDAAAVLLIYGNPSGSWLNHSAFVNNRPHGTATICVASGQFWSLKVVVSLGEERLKLRIDMKI
jgi:hypothetical protein